MEIKKGRFECQREGLTIRGRVFRPAKPAAPLPAVIISHGFMANSGSVKHYAEHFARWGYAAYCYDFCGGCVVGKSDGATTDMSVFTEREDLKAVIDYVKSRRYVDSNRLLLMGCSQGGFVSGLTAAQIPDEIMGLIMFYPALSIPDDARKGHMVYARFDPANIPEVVSCGPMKLGRIYPESVLTMDPFEEIKSYPGPVLITHGTNDRLVDVSYSKQAYRAYTGGQPKQHPEKKLQLIEGGAHGFSYRHDKIAIAGLRKFLREQIETAE